MVAKMPRGEAITLFAAVQRNHGGRGVVVQPLLDSGLGPRSRSHPGRRRLPRQPMAGGAGVSRRAVQPSQSRCRRDHPGRPIGRAGSPSKASDVPGHQVAATMRRR
jgi:hypothetical protein